MPREQAVPASEERHKERLEEIDRLLAEASESHTGKETPPSNVEPAVLTSDGLKGVPSARRTLTLDGEWERGEMASLPAGPLPPNARPRAPPPRSHECASMLSFHLSDALPSAALRSSSPALDDHRFSTTTA